MRLSVFDIFKPGVGPSSSHTMGPMSAGLRFARELEDSGDLGRVAHVEIELMGSLAATGKGHRSDVAVQLGLSGFDPATVGSDAIEATLETIRANMKIVLNGVHPVCFDPSMDILWTRDPHPVHPNALRFSARHAAGELLSYRLYFSVGGGFVSDEAEMAGTAETDHKTNAALREFASANDMLDEAAANGVSIADLVRDNERILRSDAQIDRGLDTIWERMEACIRHGLSQEGILPGGLRVPRRARRIYESLKTSPERLIGDPLAAMDFVNVWALAVNEENAAGGAVVTAPTNGAAGIVPAVIMYYHRFRGGTAEGIRTFLLTAAAVGSLCKRNAAISGAEVGCQGEVGVACSMAAAGLTAALGGTNAQIENAAEIAMEHNLGLTCDPIGGLVQIPCIERNAMGSIKAIDASRLALLGDGNHYVSLDKVIATMRATGVDMLSKYKETGEGGLAVNVVEC